MKIEIGKQYLMANGLVATIMEYQPGKHHPWRGMFGTEFNGGSMSWDDAGEQCNRAEEYRILREADPVDAGIAAYAEELGRPVRIKPLTEAEINEMHGDVIEPFPQEEFDALLASKGNASGFALHTTPPDIVAITAISRAMRGLAGENYEAVIAWFAARYPACPF